MRVKQTSPPMRLLAIGVNSVDYTACLNGVTKRYIHCPYQGALRELTMPDFVFLPTVF